MTQPGRATPNELLTELRRIVSERNDRPSALQQAADALRGFGGYRWVGLYDVDHAGGMVRNVVWSGPSAPEYPDFPIGKGLTTSAITLQKTINVGDVAADPRYLTAFGTTRSEIIVPILDHVSRQAIGTIDVESEVQDAFSRDVQRLLETCAEVLRPLWTEAPGSPDG